MLFLLLLSSFATGVCVSWAAFSSPMYLDLLFFLYRSWSLQGDQRNQHLWIPAASLGHLHRCARPRGAEEDSRERRGDFISCPSYYLLISVVIMPLCVIPVRFDAKFCFRKASCPLRCKKCVGDEGIFCALAQEKKYTFLTVSGCCHFCN